MFSGDIRSNRSWTWCGRADGCWRSFAGMFAGVRIGRGRGGGSRYGSLFFTGLCRYGPGCALLIGKLHSEPCSELVGLRPQLWSRAPLGSQLPSLWLGWASTSGRSLMIGLRPFDLRSNLPFFHLLPDGIMIENHKGTLNSLESWEK